ncbi:hypothetical protein WR25_13635 [Diploscapter pachys]|uniref:Uncharacterized protein n=1 Tax=Diploscapter pachys TaxID=2018661 RepID=A0A2A2KPJ6_9BILA|nr:hypothetical protein WR25_13635 [Diploscapter pachys]
MAHPNLGKYDGISRGSSTVTPIAMRNHQEYFQLRETREFLELFDSAYILGDTNEGAVKRFELEVLKNPDKYNTEKGRSEIYTKVRRLFQNKEPSLAVVQKHWEATYTLAKKLVDYKYDDAFKKLEF